MAERTRWRAPDLTPDEAGALDAADAYDESDAAFMRRWAETAGNPNWYEELKATWGRASKSKARSKA